MHFQDAFFAVNDKNFDVVFSAGTYGSNKSERMYESLKIIILKKQDTVQVRRKL